MIFERFFRVDASRNHGDSTNCGLGLAIVKGYAELLGAGLEVTSELGQGSKFKIVLPAPLNKETFATSGI